MRLRPGFLRANSSRNVSDASTTSARDGGGSDDNGGSRKVREIFSRPTLLPPRHSRGNSDSASACNARTSSGTSQTSVASLLSSRGILSPTAAYLGNNDRRGRGSGSYRRRASTAPVDPGRRGVDHDKPASRWGRRRSSGAVRAASEVIIVKAIDLNDQGLGVLAGGGLGAPRTIRGGRWGASFDEGVDLDDEQLTRRRRGDGDGVSDEEDEGEDEDDRDGDRGVLGKPSLGPWKDGLLADRSGGVLFSAGATLDENPAGSTPALFCDEDGTASSRASAKPGGSPVEAAVPAEFGSGEGRRQHRTAVAAAAEAATVSPDVERQAQERVNGRVNGRQDTELAEAAEDNDAWWSLRPVRQEDGSRWWSSTQDTEKGDSGSWWSTRKSGASSSDGGGDERRWSSASSLLAQAVSALSPWNPKPPPASPPQAPAATAVYLPPTTVAAEDSAVESRADGGSTERQGLVCGVGERAAVVPEVVLPGEKAGAERQRLLLESSFFCKENRTEELRVVLRSRELRAGFKQFLAKRWCAENLLFVEDVMRYQEAIVRQAAGGVAGSVTALSLGKAIEDAFLTKSSPREVNIGDCMREACLDKRARDVELRKASMDTFTPVVLELLALMAHTSLRDFRASAHYATIEACLHLGPRHLRNSGADEEHKGDGEGKAEGGRRTGLGGEEEEEEEGVPWQRFSSRVAE